MTNLDQSGDVQKFQEVSSTEEASKSTKWMEVELTAIFVDTWNDVEQKVFFLAKALVVVMVLI